MPDRAGRPPASAGGVRRPYRDTAEADDPTARRYDATHEAHFARPPLRVVARRRVPAAEGLPVMQPSRRRWTWRRRGPGLALVRRGVHHGFVQGGAARRVEGTAATLWATAEPVHIRGALLGTRRRHATDIHRTRALLERAAEGDAFRRYVWRRLAARRDFSPGGASRDLADERELEKVHADRIRGGRAVDLWAKLSRISRDPRDRSLRIRFSFGSELHDDWHRDPRRSRAADDLAEAVFPECRVLSRNRAVLAWLRRATGGPVRLSERILFANAPGGGAAFHHDAETGQLGVAYAQLAGRTAWLAVPKRELAALVRELAPPSLARRLRTPGAALRALARDLPALERLLNADARLTRALAERGRLHVLSAGDLFLLPSPGPDDVAWHSVFALGRRPSLALSFGIFRDRSGGR